MNWDEAPEDRPSQASVRKVDNSIEQKGAMRRDLKARDASAGEMQAAYHVMLTPEQQLAEDRTDFHLSNIKELEREIARQKDPKARELLVEEHNRIKSSLSDILGIR